MFKKLTPLSTEEEIKSLWKHTDRIYTSIVCTCYNQELYIKDALNSFLAQKTEYAFEIVIHDDASTDATCAILREYENNYPNLIKVIYQTENQYSKGNVKVESIAIEQSKGEYIALCEGDDFWVDEYKLEKQLNLLLQHPTIKLCFTAAFGLFSDKKVKRIAQYSDATELISVHKVIRGGGDFIPTASIMVAKSVMTNLPKWFCSAPVGDIFIQIAGAQQYGVLFIPDCTTVYRIESIGSWSSSQKLICENKVKNSISKQVDCFKLLADKSPFKKDFQHAILNLYISNALKAISQKRYHLAKHFIKLSNTVHVYNKRKIILLSMYYLLPVFRFMQNNILKK
ncbi:glycosyltransferase family 2 protein [Pseudoalteromonas sp. SG44-5]|uniref:glycosyltransferase family 2 protein n=1 Tax=Pseudoalteromonas sp. SG44-5 TaxID=2760960 RepID=UPI0015FA3F43|nr:glycosyltransferase family A protein [Pseudoalteromonas sp. SG44-5]MBB1406064.1 glycosyltransferase family 2 protein [Pseudoalteromonas sp. SG44-5]